MVSGKGLRQQKLIEKKNRFGRNELPLASSSSIMIGMMSQETNNNLFVGDNEKALHIFNGASKNILSPRK